MGTTRAPATYDGVPAHQLALLRPLDVPVADANPEALPRADLVLDALIGYGLDGPPRGDTADLIRGLVEADVPTLSLDVPSGFNAATGVPSEPTVQADATLTLALPKCGLDAPDAASAAGDLYLGDLGIPPFLYDRLDGIDDVGGLFARRDLVRLR